MHTACPSPFEVSTKSPMAIFFNGNSMLSQNGCSQRQIKGLERKKSQSMLLSMVYCKQYLK